MLDVPGARQGGNAHARWSPHRFAKDCGNSGLNDAHVRRKMDQEPSAANLQTLQAAARELRTSFAIFVKNPVGESAANARVENTMRRVRQKATTLKDQIEQKLQAKLQVEAGMFRRVRWVPGILSDYAPGGDRKKVVEENGA